MYMVRNKNVSIREGVERVELEIIKLENVELNKKGAKFKMLKMN